MDSTPQQVSRTVRTDAGLCAIWQTEYFTETGDPDDWDDWASDDELLVQAISAGALVPIGVGADGVFEVLIRWNFSGPGLTERERRCVLVSSEPYLLASPGVIYVGGLEESGDLPGRDANRIELPRGLYSVVVNLIDWKAEPESVGKDGRPLEGALPDFVVEIRAEEETGKAYRAKSATFDRP
ncbi:hypothetical protein [Streptomyces sp. NPDC058683]|uniref:hypothetical protein n=1 Tax=Streptomyces sp. NPDC058683 TaxID=3346597 RepID=UPI00365C3C9E